MADRIHPSSDDSGEFPPPPRYGRHYNHHSSSSDPSASPLFPSSFSSSSNPPSGQFVVQLPKDQVYRVPPPENAHLLKSYARRAARRRGRSCFCALRLALALLLSLALLAAVAAAALFFALRPKLPSYSLLSLSVHGLNLSSPSPSAPEFAAAIRARNPNGKIAIEYRGRGSAVAVSYGAANLADGVWPAFDQGPRNVTAFVTALRGAGVRLSPQMRSSMAAAERRGAVPLTLDASVPVRVRAGAVTTWTVTVKVRCGVTVDSLAPDSKVVSESCHIRVDIF